MSRAALAMLALLAGCDPLPATDAHRCRHAPTHQQAECLAAHRESRP